MSITEAKRRHPSARHASADLPQRGMSTYSRTQLQGAFWDACDRLDNLFGDPDESGYYEARDDLFSWLDEVAALAGVDVAEWLAESAGFPWEA